MNTNKSTDLLLSSEHEAHRDSSSSLLNASPSRSTDPLFFPEHRAHRGSSSSLSSLHAVRQLLRRNSLDCVRLAPVQGVESLRRNSMDHVSAGGVSHRKHHDSQLTDFLCLPLSQPFEVTSLLKTEEDAHATAKCMRLKEVGQYAYLVTALYGLPVALVASLPAIRPALFWVGSSSIFLTTIWLVAEAFASFKSWRDSRLLHAQTLPSDLPLDVAAVISAYLSNEIDVIEDTIKSVSSLNIPDSGRLEVVVAHNGGNAAEMVRLSELINTINTRPNVKIKNLHVSSSHSKAENVNAAISYLSAQTQVPIVCVMYDADHQPDANAMVYALHSMSEKNAQLLQGRCVIKRGSPLLAAEFDTIYGVNHAGGSILRNFAFFGGTNGYWNFDLLTKIGMDESMLTEDIDSSFRSLSSGAKIIYDPLVTSYEEAPDSLDSLMKQRMRWAQGWSQVSVRHLQLLGHDKFSVYRKAMIFLILHWREMYYYLTPLTLPAAIASFITNSKFAYPLIAVSIAQIMVPTFMAVLARYHVKNDRHPDLNSWQYAKYIVVAPVYDTVKNAVCVLGHFRNTCNMTKWRVTSRAKPVASPV